ncbi:hypothetical protein M2386_003192 [Erwinia rhapontici]|nr:hypothetical protein [Erwinia rhapontici]
MMKITCEFGVIVAASFGTDSVQQPERTRST